MKILYKKTDNGFEIVDLTKPETVSSGVVVYDSSASTMAPQYLVNEGNKILLYLTRKTADGQYTLVQQGAEECSLSNHAWQEASNSNSEEWKRISKAAPASFEVLSDAEKTILQRLYQTHQVTQSLQQYIQERLPALTTPDTAQPQSIQDHIKSSYTRHVIEELQNCLSGDFSLDKLAFFLKNHWEKIKGTTLCYTAQPDHPATIVLCDIAKKLADSKNQIETQTQRDTQAQAANTGSPETKKWSAISLLMPGINTESAYYPSSFKNLDTLEISDVLKTHITSDNHCYLIPVQIFAGARTASPEETTDDDAPTAALAADHNLEGTIYPIIKITNDFNKLSSPYWNMDDEFFYLTPGELQRLALHNPWIRSIFNAKKEYDAIAEDTSTLLGQLNQLIAHLKSADAHGGRGTQEVAASGAFPAIAGFNAYYNKLTDEQKQTIPGPVKMLIDTLIRLATSKQTAYQIEYTEKNPSGNEIKPGTIYLTKNNGEFQYAIKPHKGDAVSHLSLPADILPGNMDVNNIETHKDRILNYLVTQKHIPESKQFYISQAHEIETCIGNQSSNLRNAVDNHHQKLNDISLSEERKQTALDELLSQFQDNQIPLTRIDCISGRDTFYVNKKIIDLLKIPARDLIKNDVELNVFMLLEPDEIKELLQIPEVKSNFKNTVGSFENWVIGIIENSANKIQVVLNMLGEDFCYPQTGIIKTPQELGELLIAQPVEKCRAVCEALKDTLPNIIKNGGDFGCALLNLSVGQCAVVCEALKDKLPNIIRDERDFGSALQFLSVGQCAAVCEALKDKLPNIIRNGSDFVYMLKNLSVLRRTVVIEALKDKLPNIIRNERDFGSALQFLSVRQCAVVCEALKDKLPNIIKNGLDFRDILENLPVLQRTVIFEALKDTLPNIIRNVNDFGLALQYLSVEQRTVIFEALKDTLPNIIRNVNDFGLALQYLSVEQRTVVFEALKNTLPNIIKNGRDFGLALHCLSAEQRTVIFEASKDKLPSIIQCGYDFGSALHYLTEEQRTVIFEASKDKLPNIIASGADFMDALKLFDYKKRIMVFKEILSLRINSNTNFEPFINSIYRGGFLTESEKTGGALAEIQEVLENDKIKCLCEALFDEISKTNHPDDNLLNFDNNRLVALLRIKEEILRILKKTEPGTIIKDNFDRAEKILLLSIPNVNAPAFFKCSSCMKDDDYLKHKKYFDSLPAKQPDKYR